MERVELQLYFKERMIELLHKDTLDSHRVRTHNVYSLLKELRELIVGWKNSQIKQFETVRLCINETVEALKQDSCLGFSFYVKQLFLQDLEEYRDKGEKDLWLASRILMCIDKCISFNKEIYLPTLLDKMERILFAEECIAEDRFIPVIKEIDMLISAFCCELLYQGYSKIHLYVYINKQINKNLDFRTFFDAIKSKFLFSPKKEFIVIFRLSIPQSVLDMGNIPEFEVEVDEKYAIPQKYKNFIKPATSIRFYLNKCKASDPVSAIKISKGELAALLDILHLGMSKLSVEIPNTALVLTQINGNTYVYERNTQFVLDGNYSNDNSLSLRFKEYIDCVRKNKCISSSVKRRLDSALRHLRIGDAGSELEQRFINYWIALEFIFSSPETKEATYTRLNMNLVNILTCCYAKRNLLALNDRLISEKLIISGTNYWEKEDVDAFIKGVKSPLLKYRLLNMKSRLFTHKDKIKDFVTNHEHNLAWHIARIYRLRNELIHEAAIKQDIENVTSNLRYYLVFLLNQIIVYFANVKEEKEGQEVSLENFFYEYEIWKKRIKQSWDFNVIMSVPVEMDLLN